MGTRPLGLPSEKAALPPRFGIVLVIALLAPFPGAATDYYVRRSGNDGNAGTSAGTAWRTIQHALDTMAAGDTTWVGAGNYNEAVRSRRHGTAAAAIALIADRDGAKTGDAGTVRIHRGGSDVVSLAHRYHLLRGFRITGGGDAIDADDADGLVLDQISAVSNGDDGIDLDRTDATLTSCTIDRSRSNGLEATGAGTVTVSGATVVSNARNDGVFGRDVTLTIDGATIHDNRSEGIRCENASLRVANATIRDSGEDGLECFRGAVTVADSSFEGNGAEGIQLGTSGSLTVSGTSVSDSAETGVQVSDATLDVRDTKVSSSRWEGVSLSRVAKGSIRQTSIHGSGRQGLEVLRSTMDAVDLQIDRSGEDGIRVSGAGDVRVFGATLADNRGDGIEVTGGAVFSLTGGQVERSGDEAVQVDSAATGRIYRSRLLASGGHGVYVTLNAQASLVNSIVAGSKASGARVVRGSRANLWHVVLADNGSDGLLVDRASAFLTNSIVSGSRGHGIRRTGSGSAVTHAYNVLWANRGGHFSGTSAGTGEVFTNPSFVAAGDFHLLASSPAIDAGTDASATTSEDLEGNPRPLGGAFDIGAYEALRAARVDHFAIGHDGHGVYCLGERITVTALDTGGLAVDDYTGAITLDTQTGKGTWAAAASNQGGFADATPNDGIATYTFTDADDGMASFTLTYLEGGTPVDVDAFETATPTVRDDDAEGSLAWAPSGIVVTASALTNPPPAVVADPIPSQTAGSPFSLHLTAYGQTPNDPTCGVIESYTGSRPLAFWGSHLDPTTGALVPTVGGVPIAASEAAALPHAVTFGNGQAVVSAKYKDVGRIQIGLKDESVTEPAGGITGSTNAFVVRPDELEITAVRRPDGSPNPAVPIPTGSVFVAAGSPFEVELRVLDAEGSLTPSFGREASPERLRLHASTLVAPGGGRNGTTGTGAILNATAFAGISPAGTFRGTTFGWDEVGAIRLQASLADGSYLGTGDVTGSESGTVGRFTPDHFDVALNTPSFATACPAGGFGYVGQPVSFAAGQEPEVTATARNAQGTTTENYTGSWFRLDGASQTGLAFLSATGSLTAAAPNPPSVTPLGAGIGRLSFTGGPDLGFVRSAPIPAFDAEIELRFDLQDQDGVAAAANPVRFGQATPGLGIAFDTGKEQRFGRMALANAHGSELAALGVPLRAELWNGSAFVAHAADVCSPASTAWLGLAPQPPSLPTTPSIANDPLFAGDAGLALSAPGAGQTGHVDLLFDLTTATGADLPWLFGDWDGDGGWLESPSGRATFGIFAGEGRTIYVRDAY